MSANNGCDVFWEHIRATADVDPYQHAEKLSARLAALPQDEILDFHHMWHVATTKAYSATLWAAASVISERRILDDEFEYFVGWLILQGREVFDTVVGDPDRLAAFAFPEAPSYEGYPAYNAWRAASDRRAASDQGGSEGAWSRFVSAAEERHGDYLETPELDEPTWHDNDAKIRQRLPMLAARFL
jgi:Protein of unknown function (DUF4240)